MLRNRLTTRLAWILGIASWLVLSCALQREPSGPQGWWAEHGPVVPHELFPADCSLCHLGEGWRTVKDDFRFDHAAETGVALEGAHAKAECLRCHNDRGPVALFVARGCAGCHQDPHRAQLGPDCTTCHEQDSWRPKEVFAEHARTRFPLVGAHAAAACWRCHPGAQVGNFAHADTECLACHADDLARATSPDHAAMGWTDCQRCHLPTGWSGSAFVHPAWPLTGRHAQIDCTRCHAGGTYAGTPRECVDCHLAEYQGVSDPNHVQLNFPTECQRCHGTSTWSGAVFSHSGLTANCVDCHLADYQATTNPDHAASGFGTACEQCHHSTRSWNASFSHDQFPIRGGHRGLDCTDCHLNPSNYDAFSCTHCHAHNQSDMAREHREVGNYVWNSQRCYECHRNGRGED